MVDGTKTTWVGGGQQFIVDTRYRGNVVWKLVEDTV